MSKEQWYRVETTNTENGESHIADVLAADEWKARTRAMFVHEWMVNLAGAFIEHKVVLLNKR